MKNRSPRHLILGRLNRDYIITHENKFSLDVPGGNVLYAAAGGNMWVEADERIGLVARVGEDYPRAWISDFERRGFDVGGIRIIQESIDLRSFRVYSNLVNYQSNDPVKHFARLEATFPKTLLGYKYLGSKPDSTSELSQVSLRQSDLTSEYLYAGAAHICPVDYLTHSLIPAALRQAGFTTITLDPGKGYMYPEFWNQISGIVNGLTAFLPSESEVRSIFKGKTEDIIEMLETMGDWGAEIVVIKRGERGQLLYVPDIGDKFEIPAYPARAVSAIGGGDAFCGGFLTGYRKSFNPIQGVVYGNISASVAVEGEGAFYSQGILPGLIDARYDSLIESVRKI